MKPINQTIAMTLLQSTCVLAITVPMTSHAFDLNGDGLDDAIIGVPGIEGSNRSGFLSINHGANSEGYATGLIPDGSITATTTIGGQQPGWSWRERMGSAVTVGDFNGDGQLDIVGGGPANGNLAGSVIVVYGEVGARYFASDWYQLLSQDTPGVPGIDEEGDEFGAALVAGDFNSDGFDDLAIGAPKEDLGETEDAGAVTVLYGSAAGLDPSDSEGWTQNISGVKGTSEASDRFGSSLASGDFDDDGYADLAIGVPGENDDGGAVNILFGGPSGLSGVGDQIWSQDTPGVGGTREAGDRFGKALAVGDFNDDGHSDLAIGVPGENDGAGAVNVLLGGASGLTESGDSLLMQSAPLDGLPESDDYLGHALAVSDFNRDGHDDLVIGAPGENNVGMVHIIFGVDGRISSGTTFSMLFDNSWTFGINVASYTGFGSAISAGDYYGIGRPYLLVGAPYFTISDESNARNDAMPSNGHEGAAFVLPVASGFWSGWGIREPVQMKRLIPGPGTDVSLAAYGLALF